MFIVLEGLDGSGKSTQLKLLQEYLIKHNRLFHYIHFPRTDTPFFGELIARFLRGELGENDKVDPYLVALLYAGDRRDAAKIIEKYLKENYTVIADRYVFSNIAYQCAKLNDDKLKQDLREWIIKLEYEYFNIPRPHLNIYFDVPIDFVEKNLARRQGSDRNYLKGAKDIHEMDIKFQEKVRAIYHWLAQTEPTMRIIHCYKDNEMLSPDEIFSHLLTLIEKII